MAALRTNSALAAANRTRCITDARAYKSTSGLANMAAANSVNTKVPQQLHAILMCSPASKILGGGAVLPQHGQERDWSFT
jgi:hypothetical protein